MFPFKLIAWFVLGSGISLVSLMVYDGYKKYTAPKIYGVSMNLGWPIIGALATGFGTATLVFI